LKKGTTVLCEFDPTRAYDFLGGLSYLKKIYDVVVGFSSTLLQLNRIYKWIFFAK